jgi:2TM domain
MTQSEACEQAGKEARCNIDRSHPRVDGERRAEVQQGLGTRRLARAGVRGHTRRVTKTYTRQEVDEILRRALSEKSVDGISHDDLLAAAREVGIPSSAIEAAAAELGDNQRIAERAQLIRRRKRAAFLRHLLLFIVVNAGIFYVDQSDGGALWFQYPLIIWGVILVSLGITQLAPDQQRLERRAERELEKDQRRMHKRRRLGARAAGDPSASPAREFETAVQDGVSTLLSSAARAIRAVVPEKEQYRVPEERDDEAPASAGAAAQKAARNSQRS